MNIMTIRVKGENAPDKAVSMYVHELIKAHPDMKIRSVDIIVDGDKLKIKMQHEDLGAA